MITIPTPPILAKDRHILNRLERELHGNFPPDIKEKKRAELAKISERSAWAVQARFEKLPANLADTLNADLPVTARSQDIVKLICDHQVVIIAGETGSGKTTQLPKLALLAGRGLTGQIGHTQPRRIAARSVATRIAEELGEPLGQTVSFKVRFDEKGDKNSYIKLMTDGILLAELAHDPYLTAYDTIIIDEAHERSLNIDFIMGYLKRLLPKRPDLKVIITSATLDTERFAEYFTIHGKKPPICVVEGRSYPVEIRYRPLLDEMVTGSDDDNFDELEDKLPRALVDAVNECVADSKQKGVLGDILVFCATEGEIRELADIVSQYAPPHTQVLTLFARQSIAEQNRIFAPSTGRRVILSTNVAETALTVPNIRYVIDLGFARISRYNYRSRVQRLPIEAISQAAANQRAGRCGRLSDGVCIRLYSKEDFDARPKFTEPEILRTNLASVILQMAYLNLGEVDKFDFITPPDFRLINDGKKLLHELSALTDKPTKTALKKRQSSVSNLTHIGKLMAKMPIDPRLARMLIAGSEFDCLADVLIIVSALAVQDIRERPADKQAQADQKHALFRVADSDFLFYINAFQALFGKHELNDFAPLSGNARKNFAKKHYLSYPRIREWQKTHSQLSQMMTALGFDSDKMPAILDDSLLGQASTQEKSRLSLKTKTKPSALPKPTQKTEDERKSIHYANIHRSLLTALLSFVAKASEVKGEYQMTKNHKGYIFPASTLHKKGVEWLMAFEVVETSKVYLRCVAKIEPSWILAAAGELLKYHYFEPHWSKKTGRVRAYAQISLFGLIVAPKEIVNFEKIDPVQSREIFIMDALVANNLGVETDFLRHNQAKIDQLSDTEDRLRRRDLLVDESVLYEFYEDKLPTHIVSKTALLEFISDKNCEQSLYFADSDIVNEAVNVNQHFPSTWQVGALKLPLSYVFDPSSEDDGVSVKVPVSALSQLNVAELLWGIDAWRGELVVQLLKTLPKEHRRHLVPIPDTAKKVLEKLDNRQKVGLLDQLCQILLGFGAKVQASDFDFAQIDKHLQPLICVVNEKSQLIDKSRDLQKLQLKYQHKQSDMGETDGIHTVFPEHFHFVAVKKISGVQIQEFHALQAGKNGKAVNIVPVNDLLLALKTHKLGVLSLIKLNLSSRHKQLTSQIDKALKMAFAPLGDLEKLKDILVHASLVRAFDECVVRFEDSHETKLRESIGHHNVLSDDEVNLLDKLPLSHKEFEVLQKLVLEKFLSVGQTMLKILKDIYTTWQVVRGQLLMLDNESFADSISDIEDQLDDLVLGEFVYKVESGYWADYVRYLQALKIRLDRLPYNVQTDLDGVYALDEPMERLAKVRLEPKFAPYRWAVEEYRINLFAQPMKTKYPISDKRLEKIWLGLTTK